jgi:hypothetical protein
VSDRVTATDQRWVAFGSNGAIGSIHRTDDGFAVKRMSDGEVHGVYPTLDIAKSAMHASLPSGSDWPEFREH